MKRLLAYLFIVLGFGLTFSVNVYTYESPKFEFSFCQRYYSDENRYYYHLQTVPCSSWNSIGVSISEENYITGSLLNTIKRLKRYNLDIADDTLDRIFTEWRVYKSYGIDGSTIAKVASKYKEFHVFEKSINKNGFRLDKSLLISKKPTHTKKTQIAKAEPSQTQNLNDFQRGLKAAENEDYSKAEDLFRKFIIENPKDKKLGEVEYWLAETFRARKLFTDAASAYLEHYQKYPMDSYGPQNLMKLGMMMIEIGEKKQGCKMIWGVPIQYPTVSIDILNRSKFEAYYYDCPGAKKVKKISLDKNIDIELLSEKNNKTQIAKAEPTITPKKKVKVTKKEPKQEEFKPKKTNQDNEAPVIEIAEAITVDSQAYTLKGKVKDKSQIYLTIDGRQVEVKKGKFKLDRFNIDPDVTENIKIVAIDKWNNRTEKTIKVTIDLQSTDIAKVYEQLKPNNIKVKTDKNKIAIIIGIEKYENLINLDAKYANRDAKAFRAYATRALGIKPSNIKVLIDDKANRGNTLEAFKIWLPKIAGKGGKDIHIFFAGHGLASENGKDLYILPQDGNAKLLDDTAITRVELITLIQKVNPKSVTMFFDTCYSGQTRDERMLVASLLRPIQIISEEQDTPDNFTIFSASNYDQVSGGIEEAQHGMFSYYLMKGLEGKADENKDRKITNGELIAYLKDNVSQEAFTQNREQDPMLAGDPDKILIKF